MNLAQTKEKQQSSSGREAGAWSDNSGTSMQRQLNTGDGAGIPGKNHWQPVLYSEHKVTTAHSGI